MPQLEHEPLIPEDATDNRPRADSTDGPGRTFKTPPDPRPFTVWAFLLLFGVLFLWNSWERDFWNPNEPRVALITRTMESGGDWLRPTAASGPTFHTPPLLYWLSALCHGVTGLNPLFSYRLPVGVAAVLGLWLTYLTGKRLADGRVGFLAAAIQASTYFYFRRAGWLDDDLVFAVFCQLALTAFVLAGRGGRHWPIFGWLGLAGAGLTKSVILAPVLVFGALMSFAFLEPGRATVRSYLRRAASPLGVTVFLMLTAPWYVWALAQHGGEFFREHVVEQHFARLIDAEHHRRLPPYYLITLAVGFLPWTIFLPLGVLHAKDRLGRPCERFGLLTAIFILVVLSFVSSKKPGYLLLAWPALSLCVATGLFEIRDRFSLWEDYLRDTVVRCLPLLLRVPLVVVGILAVVYYTGYLAPAITFVMSWPQASETRLAELFADREQALYSLALLAAAAVLTFALSRRVRQFARNKEYPRAVFEFACGVVFLFFMLSFFYEGIDSVKSSRHFLEGVNQLPKSAPVAVYGYRRPAIAYHVTRPLSHLRYPDPLVVDDPAIDEVRRYLQQIERAYIVTSAADLRRLRQLYGSLDPYIYEARRGYLGWTREYVLVTNKPAE